MVDGCASHKLAATDYDRIATYAISPATDTTLSQKLKPLERNNPLKSGFFLIPNGRDAFLIRIAMIEAAEKTVDLQYYTISNDITGQLLLEALLKAADRGVRVRVLIDELNIGGADETLSVLNQHPHIEVRVFNPFATEGDSVFTRLANVVTDVEHFSRRMHNKAFIVDNQVAVVGGRNLGDAYFGFNEEFNFHDIDVLSGGPIVANLSQSYDKYWNSEEAYPISVMHPPMLETARLNTLRASLQQHWQKEKEAGELRNLIPLAEQIAKGRVKLIWAKAELAADDPRKIDKPVDENIPSKPQERIDHLADNSQREFIIVTPYFIPGDEGVDWLLSMVKEGVRVRVLTNSLASTDVVAVHARYRHYRKKLIAGGVELYELIPLPGVHYLSKDFRSGSRASLHTKVYVIDRKNLVVGSFNFDQRSEHLNTELVMVIHSSELARQVAGAFERIIAPETSYQVMLDKEGQLEWRGEEHHRLEIEDEEPEAGFWRRLKSDIISIFPIDSQL